MKKETMKKNVVISLRGFLKQTYDFSIESEYERAYNDLKYMFTLGSRKKINGLWLNVNKENGIAVC